MFVSSFHSGESPFFEIEKRSVCFLFMFLPDNLISENNFFCFVENLFLLSPSFARVPALALLASLIRLLSTL